MGLSHLLGLLLKSVPRGVFSLLRCQFLLFILDLSILLLYHHDNGIYQCLSRHLSACILRGIVEKLLELLCKSLIELVVPFLCALDRSEETLECHWLIVFLSERLGEVFVENLNRCTAVRIFDNHVLTPFFFLSFWHSLFILAIWGRFCRSSGPLFSLILVLGICF